VRRPGEAIDARMRAPAVRVDRPRERQRSPGHVVDDRLRLSLDELDAPKLGSVGADAPKLEELLIQGHGRDRIEHTFEHAQPRSRPGSGGRRAPHRGPRGSRRR
jgi:hypothetical protein